MQRRMLLVCFWVLFGAIHIGSNSGCSGMCKCRGMRLKIDSEALSTKVIFEVVGVNKIIQRGNI